MLFFSLTGCGPFIAETLDLDGDSGDSDSDTSINTDDTAVDQENESDTRTLTSGTWRLVNASLTDDPCGWMTALFNITSGLDEYEPYTFDLFLPSQFDVSATMGRFDIKATNYGARDYIACTFIDDAFTCTTQSVDSTPVATDSESPSYGPSDWPRYWVYQIEFSGSYVDNNTLIGDALVTFPRVNPGDAYSLGMSGLGTKEQCSQTYRLTLAATNP